MSLLKVAVVYSDYYPEIVDPMKSCFKDEILKNADNWKVTEFRVFGTFEIPLMVKRALDQGFDAIAVFGCVIQGKTFHHELINMSVVPKLLDMSVASGIPIGVSILTVRSYKQAIKRSSGVHNRGLEAYSSIKSFL